jgi:glycerophosphoryl diester phosphodiesterase
MVISAIKRMVKFRMLTLQKMSIIIIETVSISGGKIMDDQSGANRHRIKDIIRDSFSSIRYGFTPIVSFELIYRLAIIYLIIPFRTFILNQAIKLSGMQYVTTYNLAEAVTKPLILLAAFFCLIINMFFFVYEISFLTLSFNQSHYRKPIGIIRMIEISFKDALRSIKPKNCLIMIFVSVLIPISENLMSSSLNSYISIIPDYISYMTSSNIFLLILICILYAAVLFIFIKYLFIFFDYALFDRDLYLSAKTSSDMTKGRKARTILLIFAAQLFYSVIIYAAKSLIIFLISIISYTFVNDKSLYTLLLTVNNVTGKILSFASLTLTIITGYSIISVLYYRYMKDSDLEFPPCYEPRDNIRIRRNRQFRAGIITISILLTIFTSYCNISMGIDNNLHEAMIMAHRGSSIGIPENTMPAFEKAVELHADYIELDVQETSDGVIVVTHDTNFKRCTGYNGNVWQMTYDEIEQLNAANYLGDKYPITRIPSLDSVIQYCQGKIKMNIELKSNGHETHLEESVADLIKKYDMEKQVVITSFTADCLEKFKDLMPDVPCGYIVDIAAGNYVDMKCADFFSVDYKSITKNLVALIHSRNKTINAWTVDSSSAMDNMINIGVDSLITNDPVTAREEIISSSDPLSKLLYSISSQ